MTDSSMISSPSSTIDPDETLNTEAGDGDEDLFPASNTTGHQAANTTAPRAQTPQNDHLNAAAPGELSPPRTQPTQRTVMNTVSDARIVAGDDETLGDDMSPLLPNATSTGGSGQDADWKPGQAWKTKKAREEMERAWDNFVDRDYDPRQYGDVLAWKVPGATQ